MGMQEIIFLIIWYTVSFFVFYCVLKFMNFYFQKDIKFNFKKLFLYGFLIIFTILAVYVIINSSGSRQSTEFIPDKS
jgi:hypothetical protein